MTAIKHGAARRGAMTPEYAIWQGMIQRCINPKVRYYAIYGGRGITVCPEWRKSFSQFISDMGSRPSPEHSIDRIDNNGNYEFSNCRWATEAEQHRNQRSNQWFILNGENLCATDMEAELGLARGTISVRRNRNWPKEKLLSPPRPQIKVLEINGIKRPLSEWAAISGLPFMLIHRRLIRGWGVENAVFTPKRCYQRKG